MSGFTNYLRTQMCAQVFGGQAGTLPAYSSLYVNLLADPPSSDGSGASGSPSDETEWAPARIEVFNYLAGGTPRWSAPVSGAFNVEVTNAQAITWDETAMQALIGSIVVTHVGLWDSLTGGQMVAHDTLDTSVAAVSTNTYTFPIGGLKVRMQGIVK